MIDALKSQAVLLYTGRGRSPFPLGDLDAVRAFNAGNANGLVDYVRGVTDEIFALFPLDWDERNNMSATQAVHEIASAVAVRHPELSPAAGGALAWMWSYSSWK